MTGLVVKSAGLWYEVLVDEQIFTARLRGKFKLTDKKLTNPLAVGDQVGIVPNDQVAGEYVINEIFERRNYVIRQSTRKRGHDHIIASNIDQGVLIVTLKKPRTSYGFIDRFLITLEAFRIPALIIFNKQDIYSKKELDQYEELKNIYEAVGYKVVLTSFQNEDVSDLKPHFMKGLNLLTGHSGSGKSTLINSLVPSANQATSEISSFANKGVHTTTFAEFFKLDASMALIDTPGIKELALSEVERQELSHYFPEMRQFIGQCKFHNCLHENEPGCMIRQQVGKQVSKLRYESYLSILNSEDSFR